MWPNKFKRLNFNKQNVLKTSKVSYQLTTLVINVNFMSKMSFSDTNLENSDLPHLEASDYIYNLSFCHVNLNIYHLNFRIQVQNLKTM